MKKWQLVAAGAVTSALVSIAGVTPVGASAGAGVIRPWSLQNENPNANHVAVPAAQATLDAKHFNVITAHDIAYGCITPKPAGWLCPSRVPAMKTANPSLKILLYMNATFAQSYQPPTPPGTGGFDPTWYEKDAQGRYITNPGTGNYLMIPNNPGWIQSRITQCQQAAKAVGYDGCYLDLLGLAPLAAGYLTAVPINPSTGAAWTQSAWLAATAALAKAVHGGVSPLLVYGNGLTDGPHFYGLNTKQIVDVLDGGVPEAWLRLAKSPVTAYPTQAAWQQDVNMIAAIEAENKPCMTLTKLWATASAAQQTAWQQFALASFLLGTQGRSLFFFSPSASTSRTTTYSLYSTNVGTPSGPYTSAKGIFQRVFSSGLVLVNPGTATVNVTLPKAYYTLTRQHVTSVTVTKDEGVILTAT